jgi:hypothetical protein
VQEWASATLRLLAISGEADIKAAILDGDAIAKLKRAHTAGLARMKVNEALKALQRK